MLRRPEESFSDRARIRFESYCKDGQPAFFPRYCRKMQSRVVFRVISFASFSTWNGAGQGAQLRKPCMCISV